MEYGISFKLTSSSYIVPKSTLLMELKLRYIKIPIQNDSSKYESLLKMQIPENQLIRLVLLINIHKRVHISNFSLLLL